ncbi:MAG: hypothetical protein BK997_02660 [Candidatus Micrarchaeum sp. ARMAN-1]|jgi:hypothetical protein|nr:MAG: hypothetical protein BK997_02660 [Candidatus Micrarchaeum sp. ARMAN-1]
MKAQMAILESVICMVLLFSAAYSIFIPASENQSELPSQLGPALFSMISVYEANQSMHTCVDSGIYSAECNATINDIVQIYGLTGLSISAGGHSVAKGYVSSCSYGKTYCIAAEDNGTEYTCVNMCG